MDIVGIGIFISELRKEQGLSQEQLGEKIGVSNKTISRWETGTYLPPADALMDMSKLFLVSINEILSGRRLLEEDYKKAAEENLTQAISARSFSLEDKIVFYKKKWLKEHIATMCLWGIFIVVVFAAGVVLQKTLLMGISPILLVIAHCWRNNAMMIYVESNAFGGRGAR